MKKITGIFVIFLTLVSLLSAQVDKSKIDVEVRFNVAAPDTANYLKINGRSDQFDAATGASKFKATSGFNAWYRTSDNKTTLPAGIRGMFLYPLASDGTRTDDNLTVSKASNGVITVTYVHRGTAYEIVTDSKGVLNVQTGAKFAANVAPLVNGKVGNVDAKYVKAGADAAKMSSVDWKKLSLIPDAPTSAKYYSGTLQLALDKNIFTIKGTLTLK